MIVNGPEITFAEVLRTCLGHEKRYEQFWETRPGRSPTLNPKNGRSKIAFLRPHREPGNRPRVKTLLFLVRVCVKLFKMSGGSAYVRVDGRKLSTEIQKGQDLLAGLYIYIYIYIILLLLLKMSVPACVRVPPET